MTTQEERLLRAALIFLISEPRFVPNEHNSRAMTAYMETCGLSGDRAAHYAQAFSFLNAKRMLAVQQPSATARELERFSTDDLHAWAEQERQARQRSYQRFRPARGAVIQLKESR